MTLIEIYVVVYVLFLVILVGIGCQIQWRKERKLVNPEANAIPLNELVVIIPFRNERERIGPLLASINQSEFQPKEYIFVDDHSEDGTAKYIYEKLHFPTYRILSLPDDLEGKKQAIRYGIGQTQSAYILGMDADITFSNDYFHHISRLQPADLYILPAILLPKRWWQRFFELDLVLVNAINCGITGLKRPLIASGANLLYSREAYLTFDRFESHAHMPSGDDIYLLRDFRNAQANVQLISHYDLAVYSETPQSMREFLHQRLRWIAKTGDVGDHLSTVLSLIQFGLTLLFLVILVYFFVTGNTSASFYLLAIKAITDMAVFFPFFKRQKRLSSWLLIPVYELVFPLYSIVIASSMYAIKPIWKGRKLQTNY
jgi:glycosyltransferase involved in cell wall biosynthesis